MSLKLGHKEVELKNGRKVVVRELTALDELLSVDLLGSKVNPEDMGSALLKQLQVQVAMSVYSVNGEKVERFKKFEDVVNFMSRFGKVDWAKINKAYNELNGETDGETEENFTKEQTDLQTTQPSENV